jgi:hypothetical protein
MVLVIVVSPYSRGHGFIKLDSALYIRKLLCKFELIWSTDFGKILKDFSYINTCKNCFPYCGPRMTPGALTLKK